MREQLFDFYTAATIVEGKHIPLSLREHTKESYITMKYGKSREDIGR